MVKSSLHFFISVAVVFSQIGFSNMVGKVYPIFGYIGIFQIILIMLYFAKLKWDELKAKIKGNVKYLGKRLTKG